MKMAAKLILMLLLTSTATLAYRLQPVKAPDGSGPYIYIKADGSIDPSEAEALINTTDKINYLIFSNVINKSIIVERDNITIQGYNHIVQGNSSLRVGIDLTSRVNVTIEDVKITKFSYGLLLNSSDDCRLFRNTIWDNWCGIWAESCLRTLINYNNASNNNFCGIRILRGGNNEMYYNTLFLNVYGILAWYSDNDILVGNNASLNWNNGIHLFSCGGGTQLINNNASSNHDYGIFLYESDNIWMSGNKLSDNRLNFGIDGTHYLDFATHTIDETNTVDGKPVYYIKGLSDTVYDASTNAGTMYLINCENVTVKDLNLTNNGCGIFLWNVTESKIENLTVSDNYYGINMRNSRNNTFSKNSMTENNYGMLVKNSNSSSIHHCNITSNQWGIHMENSALNSIYRNIISDSTADGIYVEHSHNNTIIENIITRNAIDFEPIPMGFGINLQNSANNTIYHNNFIDNGGQAEAVSSYNNTWDNGRPSGGNYWSDHHNVDADSDGIAEDTYIISLSNVDTYPLAGMFSILETPQGYDVEIVCNSTIDSIAYYQSNNTIAITVSNATSTQTNGFCRLTIPHDLMPPEYQVTVNGTLVTPITVEENSHSIIYIGYEHSTVEIIVVPEFTSAMLLLLLASSTTLAITLKKTKHFKNPKP
jgi:parallel beta-helix repeat protein